MSKPLPLNLAIQALLSDYVFDQPPDDWDEITATETPAALACEAYTYKRTNARSHHSEQRLIEVMHAKRMCHGEDSPPKID